jgi:Rrf2 family protein
MRFNQRADYAIHMIAELAANPNKPMGLRFMAQHHEVTYAYARTIQQGLQKAGIITTLRGIHGGMLLAKDLSDITVLEVFEASQIPLDYAFDDNEKSWCTCGDECITKKIWQQSKEALSKQLASITLDKLFTAKVSAE